jgi:alpha-ketoglutarate-dependent taurine dioxygenase
LADTFQFKIGCDGIRAPEFHHNNKQITVSFSEIRAKVKMTIHQGTPFQKAIEAVESLPFNEREEVLEIIRMRLAEDRSEEIAANAREAVQAVKEKRAKYGTVEDLKKDLVGG